MKAQFKLLVLGDGTESGAAVNRGLEHLRQLCTSKNIASHENVAALQFEPGVNSFVLLAGDPSASQLTQACEQLLNDDVNCAGVIIVLDALANASQLSSTLAQLIERVQITVVGALLPLLTAKHLMVSRFSKADNTSTFVALMGASGRWARWKIRLCRRIYRKPSGERNALERLLLSWFDHARVLTIVRGTPPYEGYFAFPGGFLNCFLESMTECAAREGGEECRVKIDPRWLVLVDVRSLPTRDERGHVIDHGYAWFIPSEMEASVLAGVHAGDDAKALQFCSIAELLTMDMAFDHRQLLVTALKL